MAAIQWRPEVNHLTVPESHSIRFVARNSAGIKDIAADIALRHRNFSQSDILTILRAEDEAIKARLLNGEQVTKEGSFSWSLSFTGRLDNADDPLPPLHECLRVNVRVAPAFLASMRGSGKTERLPEKKKTPLISGAEDTLLKLADVLNPAGALQLTGSGLAFDQESGGECVIEGTRSGRAAQSRLLSVSNSAVLLMPDIPAQASPWNNEYTVSVSARYSRRGSLRAGTCGRMLRAPLAVPLSGEGMNVGILTGSADSPHVSVTGGAAGADETLRIQARLDRRRDCLVFSLLDMRKDGLAGAPVTVSGDGQAALQGFAGSAVSSLSIRVNSYAALKAMIRDSYGGRLADILMITTG
jgi:hypothetical protein